MGGDWWPRGVGVCTQHILPGLGGSQPRRQLSLGSPTGQYPEAAG